MDSELSSRRQNLQDELRRVQDTVASLDAHIDALKNDAGWTTRTDAHVLWRTLASRSPVAEAVRECRARARKGRATPRARRDVAPRTTGNKRTRVLTTQEKRTEAIWAQCVSILSALKKHRYAGPFLEPVDAKALNIPDYYEVITRPMDLGTITRRLENDPRRGRYRMYTSPLEFRDDVRLVWSNCWTYNKPGQDVRIMGDTLSELWEKKWCQAEIEAKWENEKETHEEDDAVRLNSHFCLSACVTI